MKKFAALMLGMSLMLGTVSLFAQDNPKESKTEKTKKGHKGGKSKEAKPTPPPAQ
jgi:hypothetical protein